MIPRIHKARAGPNASWRQRIKKGRVFQPALCKKHPQDSDSAAFFLVLFTAGLASASPSTAAFAFFGAAAFLGAEADFAFAGAAFSAAGAFAFFTGAFFLGAASATATCAPSTSSIIAIAALSPGLLPSLNILVYPPLRSLY